MDCKIIVEAEILLLPTLATDGSLCVGEIHASRGDCEIRGNSIPISMDAQLAIRVDKSRSLSNPRLVDDSYRGSIASQSELSNNMDFGVCSANSGMFHLLQKECALTSPEAHLLLGSVVKHNIVTCYGSDATLMPKTLLPSRCHVLGNGDLGGASDAVIHPA